MNDDEWQAAELLHEARILSGASLFHEWLTVQVPAELRPLPPVPSGLTLPSGLDSLRYGRRMQAMLDLQISTLEVDPPRERVTIGKLKRELRKVMPRSHETNAELLRRYRAASKAIEESGCLDPDRIEDWFFKLAFKRFVDALSVLAFLRARSETEKSFHDMTKQIWKRMRQSHQDLVRRVKDEAPDLHWKLVQFPRAPSGRPKMNAIRDMFIVAALYELRERGTPFYSHAKDEIGDDTGCARVGATFGLKRESVKALWLRLNPIYKIDRAYFRKSAGDLDDTSPPLGDIHAAKPEHAGET